MTERHSVLGHVQAREIDIGDVVRWGDLLLGLTTIPVTGVVLGEPLHRGTGPDLSFVAEGWLRDARALGMRVMLQPDGQIRRTQPLHDDSERAQART